MINARRHNFHMKGNERLKVQCLPLLYGSSSSHADDANTITDLCDLARGQHAFTSREIVFKGV